MAEVVGLKEGFEVYYGSYHVENGIIEMSNLPGKVKPDFAKLLDEKLKTHTMAELYRPLNKPWVSTESEVGLPLKDFILGDLMNAMNRDAIEFSRKK